MSKQEDDNHTPQQDDDNHTSQQDDEIIKKTNENSDL